MGNRSEDIWMRNLSFRRNLTSRFVDQWIVVLNLINLVNITHDSDSRIWFHEIDGIYF